MQWLLFVDAVLLTPVGAMALARFQRARCWVQRATCVARLRSRSIEEAYIMAYLDTSPVLTALRERPHEFTVSDGWVQQQSSPYRLKAQVDGHVLVETEDGSASPLISCSQRFHLFRAIENWRLSYWIPREVNRVFARQIRPRRLWQRILDRAWLPERTGESALATYAWAFASNGPLGASGGNPPPPGHPKRPPSPVPNDKIAGSLGRRETALPADA
jgi:hypothetical protein